MTARLFTLNPLEGFRPKTFAGHRDAVLAAYFSADGTSVNGKAVVLSYTLLRLLRFRYIQSVRMALCSPGKQKIRPMMKTPTRKGLLLQLPRALKTIS